MASHSQDLKQRIKDGPADTPTPDNNYTKTKREKRTDMAKRGLRSLSIAVALPLALVLFDIYYFGSSRSYVALKKPLWFPPLWVIHTACMASNFLMGLSAWLVWAEGGFHKNPTALSFCLGELLLSLAWHPIVLHLGANWVGLILCLAMFGALAGCCQAFREVKPIASDLVKPCLAWTAFLAIVNLKLLFL
ncbi:translocator protein homolog [Pistacia vera]|uniref:translocator protein homolog n=1 Tax=Pistacia vera TaxID=55513 RepID=UPI0012630758|nr:translocator protein homolog [Pistacia vera]